MEESKGHEGNERLDFNPTSKNNERQPGIFSFSQNNGNNRYSVPIPSRRTFNDALSNANLESMLELGMFNSGMFNSPPVTNTRSRTISPRSRSRYKPYSTLINNNRYSNPIVSRIMREEPIKPINHTTLIEQSWATFQVYPKTIFNKIQFKQYSVLGEIGKRNHSDEYMKLYGSLPNINFATTAMVDAGGLPYFHGEFKGPRSTERNPGHGPRSAGGSSEALYKYIGINRLSKFNTKTLNEIKGIGDASFYKYKKGDNYYNVIHAIGPNFNNTSSKIIRDMTKKLPFLPEYTKTNFDRDKPKDRVTLLSIVYYNIFKQFIDNIQINDDPELNTLNTLNIVPISVGIFANKSLFNFEKSIDETMKSILKALEMMHQTPGMLQELNGIEINICLWDDINTKGKLFDINNQNSLCYMYKEKRDEISSQIRGGHFNSHSIKQKYNKIIKKRTLRKKNKTHKKVKLYKI